MFHLYSLRTPSFDLVLTIWLDRHKAMGRRNNNSILSGTLSTLTLTLSPLGRLLFRISNSEAKLTPLIRFHISILDSDLCRSTVIADTSLQGMLPCLGRHASGNLSTLLRNTLCECVDSKCDNYSQESTSSPSAHDRSATKAMNFRHKSRSGGRLQKCALFKSRPREMLGSSTHKANQNIQ